nr:hypothetical protein [Tanacetum cinerariifolium]
MSHDLITNELNEINLPDSLKNHVYTFLSISKLRESLVVSANINMATKKVHGVWIMVMEDDGNVASFKKLFNIDMFNTSVDKILGFMKRGEPVLENYQELEESDLSVLEVYEPWSEHMTNLALLGKWWWRGGSEFTSFCVGILGDGRDIRFWVDWWVDDRRLCDRFSRLYHLDKRKEVSVMERGEWVDNRDRWRWSLVEHGEFTVKNLSKLIEEKILISDVGGQEMLWNKLFPKKVRGR